VSGNGEQLPAWVSTRTEYRGPCKGTSKLFTQPPRPDDPMPSSVSSDRLAYLIGPTGGEMGQRDWATVAVPTWKPMSE